MIAHVIEIRLQHFDNSYLRICIYMANGDARRQRLIQKAIAKSPGSGADVAIQLWQPLAFQLVAIIGESGFNHLYARSLYVSQALPWRTPPGDGSRSVDFLFTDLKASLEGQNATEANQASRMLLLTFTDILASLIGESLTISILNSAWGDDASESGGGAGKEYQDE
jgi:hypothetical protein